MKTTYKKIVEIHDLYRKLLEMPMCAASAREWVKCLSALTDHYDKIAEKQHDLFEKYGLTQDDGTTAIDPEQKEEAGKEFEKFLEQGIELEGFPIVSMDDELKLSPIDMIRLKDFVDFRSPY